MDTSTIYIAKLPLEGTNWEMWTAVGTIGLAIVSVIGICFAWKAAMFPVREAQQGRRDKMEALKQYVHDQFEHLRRELVQARDDIARTQQAGAEAVVQTAKKVIPHRQRLIEALLDDVWVYGSDSARVIYRAFAEGASSAALVQGIADSDAPNRQQQGFFDGHVTWVLGELGRAIEAADECKRKLVEIGAAERAIANPNQ